MNLTVGKVIKNAIGVADFSHYRQGYIYYRVVIKESEGNDVPYLFPIEVSDLGGATVSAVEKPMTLMRYIRKALETGSFVRAASTCTISQSSDVRMSAAKRIVSVNPSNILDECGK